MIDAPSILIEDEGCLHELAAVVGYNRVEGLVPSHSEKVEETVMVPTTEHLEPNNGPDCYMKALELCPPEGWKRVSGEWLGAEAM